jgi:hypothetical protein
VIRGIVLSKSKALIMKKVTLILTTVLASIWSVHAQSVGDYRSIGNGNWNDATRWEIFNGSNWVNANTYPGQNSGTGVVTVMNGTEIKITGSLSHPISSLYINADLNQILPSGSLVFISENPVSLNVEGDVTVIGSMSVADQNGAKSHSLTIGGSLVAGTWDYHEEFQWCDYNCLFYYCYSPSGGYIQTISNDDKLEVIFNTTKPNSSIRGASTIMFQDIRFNGIGISVETSIYINGTARFLNGIVNSCCTFCETSYCGYLVYPDSAPPPPGGCGAIFFNDGAIALGASVNSFVNGGVTKQGNDSFTFPIGYKNEGALVPLTIYAPLTISAPVDAQDAFYAAYSTGQVNHEITDPGLYSVSNCEYWLLRPGDQSQNLTSHLDVTAGWSPSSGCGSSSYITNAPDVTLAHYNGSSWDNHGGSGVGTTTNGSVTWRGVSNFGAFTLGNINTNCVTPSALGATNITTNSATLSWSAVPGAVSYDVYYLNSYNWINVATATTSTSTNLSGLNYSTTYDWKVRANCSSISSSAYRQTQFTTSAPCGTPTALSTTNIATHSATVSWVGVTGALSYNVEYKPSMSTYWTTAVTGITSLSYNLSGLSTATGYDWRVLANCSGGPGPYAQSSFATACDDPYETNNTSSQARQIDLGGLISANISSTTDVDWFRVTVSNITLILTLSNLPADYDLNLYNKNLQLVASSTGYGTSNEVIDYNSRVRNATYYVKVVGKNGAYNISQCYNLLVQAVGSGGSITRVSEPLNESDGLNGQLLYPNPASGFVQLTFNSTVEGRYDVQIVNSVGQLVKQYPAVSIVNGYNQVKIPVKDIRPGMYILKINKDGLNLTKRFVIAR